MEWRAWRYPFYPPVGGGAFNGNVWVDPKLLTIHSQHESEETRGIIKYFTDQTGEYLLTFSILNYNLSVVCIEKNTFLPWRERVVIIARRQTECIVKRNTAAASAGYQEWGGWGWGWTGKGMGRYCCDGGGKRRDLTQIVWRLDGCDRGELAGLSLVRLDCNNDLVQVRRGWTIISRNVNLV